MIDHGFFIGNGHQVCQDYSLTSKSLDRSGVWGLCGDGCSGAKFSDVGVRLLLHRLAPLMEEERVDVRSAVQSTYESCGGLGLPHDACFASVVGLRQNLLTVWGFVCGDGVLGVLTRSKTLILFLVENHSDHGSFPFYPAYFGHHREYVTRIGTRTAAIRGIRIDPNLPPQPLDLSACGELEIGETQIRYQQRCEVSEMERNGQPFQLEIQVENPLLVGGFSDGVLTGRDKLRPPDELGLVRELFGFHDFTPTFFLGRFFYRRAKQAQRLWVPEDDLSGVMIATP